MIDGSSLAYRAFHALPDTFKRSSDDLPTGGLFGFSRMLLRIWQDYGPQTVLVAWDERGPTHRHDAFADYKSHRKPMPDALSAQWPHFKAIVESFGYINFSKPGYEGDDVIGTLVTLAQKETITSCIVTGDRDMLQLCNDEVCVLLTGRGLSDVDVYDDELVHAKTGLYPNQIRDYIALKGDTSDNIPGVAGIGKKTAVTLLQQYGDIDNLLSKVAEVTPAGVQKKLLADPANLTLSRDLATIHCQVPLELNLAQLHNDPLDTSKLKQTLATYEFTSLLDRL